MNGEIFGNQAAQHGRDGRCVRIPKSCVADQCEIGFQLVSVLGQEWNERRGGAFFFALEQDGDVAGQFASDVFPCTAGLDECH